jgi:transposase
LVPQAIWKSVITGVLRREALNLDSICYDGTNFYTFIDTFNSRCSIAERGKNKQGRNSLRQVSYALFCSSDTQIPLFYDVYDGNRHDARQFPIIIKRFHEFLQGVTGKDDTTGKITLIFDKGNNSKDSFGFMDSLKQDNGEAMHFVGSVKLGEHKELAQVLNDDKRFVPCQSPNLEGSKAFRATKEVYGKQRVLVVTYNQNLFESQWLTIQNDISYCLKQLGEVKQKLQDRANGVIIRGKKPTCQSVMDKCRKCLSRQHMKRIEVIL